MALAGATIQIHLYACRTGDQVFALAWADLGDPARSSAALVAMREGVRTRLGASAAEGLALQVPGATPNAAAGRWRISGRGSQGKAAVEQIALFSHGLQVFQASVVGERIDEPAAEAFFASLRVAQGSGGAR
jgi:hypothetical protein